MMLGHPFWKNSESRLLSKWKNSKKFFDLKFGMTKKSWYPDPHPAKNSESNALCKQENSEEFLT